MKTSSRTPVETNSNNVIEPQATGLGQGLELRGQQNSRHRHLIEAIQSSGNDKKSGIFQRQFPQVSERASVNAQQVTPGNLNVGMKRHSSMLNQYMTKQSKNGQVQGGKLVSQMTEGQAHPHSSQAMYETEKNAWRDKNQEDSSSQLDIISASGVQANNSRGNHVQQLFRQPATIHSANQEYYKGTLGQQQPINLQEISLGDQIQKMANQSTSAVVQFRKSEKAQMMQQPKNCAKTALSSATSSAVQNREERVEESKITFSRAIQHASNNSKKHAQINSQQSLSGGLSMLQMHEQALIQNRYNQQTFLTPLANQLVHNQKLLPESMTTSKEYGIASPTSAPTTDPEQTSEINQGTTRAISNGRDAQGTGVSKRKIFNKLNVTQFQNQTYQAGIPTQESQQAADPQNKLQRSTSQDHLYLMKQSSLPQPSILPNSISNSVNQKLYELDKDQKTQVQHTWKYMRNESRKSEHRQHQNTQGSNSAKPLNISTFIVNGRSPYQQINNSQAYEHGNSESVNTNAKPSASAQLNNSQSIENERNRIYDVVNSSIMGPGQHSMGLARPQSGVALQNGLFGINESDESPQIRQLSVVTNDLQENNGIKHRSTSTTRQQSRIAGNNGHARNDDNLHIARTQTQLMQNPSLANSQVPGISAQPSGNAQNNVASQPRSLYQTHQGGKYNFITPMILSDLHQISSKQQNPTELLRPEPADRENQKKLAASEFSLKSKNNQHLQKNFNSANEVHSRRSDAAHGIKLPIKSSAVSHKMVAPSKVKIAHNTWQTGPISGTEMVPNSQSQGVNQLITQREESKNQSSMDGRVKSGYFNKTGQAIPHLQRNIINETNARSNGITKDQNLPLFIQKRRRLKPPTTLKDSKSANTSSQDERNDKTPPSNQFQIKEETKQKNPAKFIKQKLNYSQINQQQQMKAKTNNLETPGSIYQNMQENILKSVQMQREANGFIKNDSAAEQHCQNNEIKTGSDAEQLAKSTSQESEEEISLDQIGSSGDVSADRNLANHHQGKREDDMSADQSEKNSRSRKTSKKKGLKSRNKAGRTNSHKKRKGAVQNQLLKNNRIVGVRNRAANGTFKNFELQEGKQSEKNSDQENDIDNDLDESKGSQPQKRQRLSQSSATMTVGADSNFEDSTERNDRAWSMASIASSCSPAPILVKKNQILKETVPDPQNREVVVKTKTSADDYSEEEPQVKDKLLCPEDKVPRTEAPYFDQSLLMAYNLQAGNENPQQDPVQFGRIKVEGFLANNPLNYRFITKEKARLPYSVFKPQANQVTFLKSIFEGRPPVAFFQYPSYVGIKRVADRIRMYTKEEVEHLYMSFRISDSAHIYNAVVNSCKSAGLTMIESNNSNLFNLQWSGYINANDIKHLNKYQKVNHFPGSTQLGRKDLLWRNMSRMRSKYPKDFAISPISYLIHEEYDAFLAERERDKNSLWILKPVNSSCGRGIKIINSTQEIIKREGLIASKYIANPHLINGLKYDMRVYVLVTSFNPLRIYMYNDGLVRFATEKYSNDPRKLQKKYVHLTNFSINKKNVEKFVKNTDKAGMLNLLKSKKNGGDTLEDEDQQEFDQNTSKWDFKMLQAAYEKQNINYEYVIAQFKDLVVKTLLCVEPHVTQQLQKNPTSRNNCFELYGFDIIVDDNYKPWILEVNVLPSLSSSSPFDKRIKTMLICDTLTLVGIRGYDKQKFHSQTTELLGLAPFAQSMTMSELRQKPRLTGSEQLTKDELEILMDLDEEFMRRGNFQRIFPLASNASFYEQFFETKRYQNALCASYLTSPQHIRDQLLSKHRRIYTSLV